MAKDRIVLVEDEQDIADLIILQAEMAGYEITHETDGVNGLRTITAKLPDLVLLDLMLPGQSGLDICRKMKADSATSGLPIIMISAKSEELDVVLGLELGADDYVTKPFSPKILLSRIKAVLRRKRAPEEAPSVVEFGDFVLEPEHYQVKRHGKPVPLTLSEFGILKRLAASRGKVLTRNQLLDEVQNDDAFIVDRNIDVHVAALRKKLGPDFKWIQTVRGVGYRFLEEL